MSLPRPGLINFFSTAKTRTSHFHNRVNLAIFPGTGCTGEKVFKRVIEEAQKKLPNNEFKVIYMPTLGHSFEKITDVCANGLRDSSLKEGRFFGLGHSLGAITAAMTADKYPHLFNGLVLSNPRYGELTEAERGLKENLYKKISGYTEDEFIKMVCRPGFFVHQEESLTDAEKQLLISEILTTGRVNFLNQLKLTFEYSLPDYPRIHRAMALSVVLGVKDKVAPSLRWDAFNSGKKVLCPSGHLSLLKYPEIIAGELVNMINAKNSPSIFSAPEDEPKRTYGI